jgi:hypothetical protein
MAELPAELPAPLGYSENTVTSPFETTDPRYVDHVAIALSLLAEQYKED